MIFVFICGTITTYVIAEVCVAASAVSQLLFSKALERDLCMSELQKASLWKRMSAYLFDVIILAVVAIGAASALSAVFGYDGYSDKLTQCYERYQEQYGIDFDISMEDFEKLTEDEKNVYYEADKAMSSDEEVIKTYRMMFNLSILIVSLGLFMSFFILEFVIPAIIGNGQTLGKKIFGVAVMRTNAVKITPPVLFIRTILGKYTIETMVPVFLLFMILFGVLGFVGVLVIFTIILLNVILVFATRTSSAIHDLLSDTVTVDMASQRIFDSYDAMIEYKKKLHAEAVSKEDY